jgi:hypothetical protein
MDMPPAAFARIVAVRFGPESLDDAFEYFRSVSVPLVEKQPGARGIAGLGNRSSGNTWALSLWQTSDDLEASNSPPDVVEALVGYGKWMTGPFSVQTYSILAGELSPPGSNPLTGEWARLTTLVPEPQEMDAAARLLGDRLVRLHERCDGGRGSLLLSQHRSNRLLSIDLWESHEAMLDSESEAMTQDQRLRIAVSLQIPPVREEAQVFGRY